MKFDYINNSKNLEKSILLAPSGWEEYRELNISKKINIINTVRIDFTSHIYLEGETNLGELFSNEIVKSRNDKYVEALNFIISDYQSSGQ